jgi:hypothetical protein
MTVPEELRAAALIAATARVASEPLTQDVKDGMVAWYTRKYEQYIKTGEWK